VVQPSDTGACIPRRLYSSARFVGGEGVEPPLVHTDDPTLLVPTEVDHPMSFWQNERWSTALVLSSLRSTSIFQLDLLSQCSWYTSQPIPMNHVALSLVTIAYESAGVPYKLLQSRYAWNSGGHKMLAFRLAAISSKMLFRMHILRTVRWTPILMIIILESDIWYLHAVVESAIRSISCYVERSHSARTIKLSGWVRKVCWLTYKCRPTLIKLWPGGNAQYINIKRRRSDSFEVIAAAHLCLSVIDSWLIFVVWVRGIRAHNLILERRLQFISLERCLRPPLTS
jgi:hypothetical protein